MNDKSLKILAKKIGLMMRDTEFIVDYGMIQNKYYTGILFDDARFLDMTKKHIDYKKKAISDALANENYADYVFLHTRPFRLNALLDVIYYMNDKKEKSALIVDVWVDSENPYINIDVWKSLFSEINNGMTTTEKKRFAELDDEVTVYRGLSHDNDCGISYTLSKEVAEFFANRFSPDNPRVVEKVVNKSDIVCYIDRRNEDEVIILNHE